MARRTVSVDGTAPLPEADRVEGFLHPRETAHLFGHERCEQELAQAFDTGRLHHGWLLAGPSGIGKATLAYRFAKYVLASAEERFSGDGQQPGLGVDEDGPAARQVRALSHPGLMVIRRPYDVKAKRFGSRIPVDAVRRIRGFLNHSSGGGAWRVVIIDTADEMNVNAANAVLKSLEEPPAQTVFLMVTCEPGRLLPTIRSRCRTLDMDRLPSEALEAASRHAFEGADVMMPDKEAWGKLMELGDGRVGRVVSLASTGGLAVFDDVQRFLEGAGNPDWSRVHALGDKLAPVAAAQRFELFFDLLLERLSQAIRVAAGGSGGEMSVRLAKGLISNRRVSRWAELWEDIARSKADVAALNLDRKAYVMETATRMHDLVKG